MSSGRRAPDGGFPRRTACRRLLGIALAAAAAWSGPILAQDAERWQIEGFGGAYFGSRISLTPAAATQITDGATFGLRASLGVTPHLRLEASFARANAALITADPATGSRLSPREPAHVDTGDLDALYGVGTGRLRGHIGAGLGVMTLPTFDPVGAPTGESTRLAANVVVGGEYALTPHFGLRLDGRYLWRVTPRRLGAVVCEEGAGCSPFTTDLYSSAQVTGGVTYRFGKLFEAPDPGSPDLDSAADGGAGPPKRYWLAAAEVLVFLDFGVMAYDRWAEKANYGQVTLETIKANFLSGFTYDRDPFSTNNLSHVHQSGSLYFNAARTNGLDFWESSVAALVGSYVWECCGEVEPPAINDLVNSTLGGIAAGETTFRLSQMILDNTATGVERVARELGGLVVNPMGELNRLLQGEIASEFPNPEDRLPSRLRLDCDLGYRRVDAPGGSVNQGVLGVAVLYGDPFEETGPKPPFSTFTLGLDVAQPSTSILTRISEKGILRGWELTTPADSTRHMLALSLGYEYINNQAEIFSTESINFGVLSRHPLGPDFRLESSIAAAVFPLAAVGTTQQIDPSSGRNYDYGPGGGVRLGASLEKTGQRIASIAYAAAWTTTSNGPSTGNNLQWFVASARLPLGTTFGAGASYSWYSRQSTYSVLPAQHRTQSDWRAFMSASL